MQAEETAEMARRINREQGRQNQGSMTGRVEESAVSLGILSANERDTLAAFGIEMYSVGMKFNRELTRDQFMTVGAILRNLKERTQDARQLLRGVEQVRKRVGIGNVTGLLKTESLALALFGESLKFIPISAGLSYEPSDTERNLLNILPVNLHVHGGETRELELAVEELQVLVNEPTVREPGLQDFFERHPNFILTDKYHKAHPHIVLTDAEHDRLIPDFLLEPVDQSALCDLLELKLPSAPVFVGKRKRIRFSAAVSDALAQLKEYERFFDEKKNRELIYQKYGLLAFKPKMILVIGRLGVIDPIDKKLVEQSRPDLSVRTYDEIIKREVSRIERLKSGTR